MKFSLLKTTTKKDIQMVGSALPDVKEVKDAFHNITSDISFATNKAIKLISSARSGSLDLLSIMELLEPAGENDTEQALITTIKELGPDFLNNKKELDELRVKNEKLKSLMKRALASSGKCPGGFFVSYKYLWGGLNVCAVVGCVIIQFI